MRFKFIAFVIVKLILQKGYAKLMTEERLRLFIGAVGTFRLMYLVRDFSNKLPPRYEQIADDAVKQKSPCLRCFRGTTAPPNGGGRPRTPIPLMFDVLCEHLPKRATLYRDEMVSRIATG